MITCTSEEAKHYKCCMMDKQCEGDSCMAWKQVFIRTTATSDSNGQYFADYQIKDSGKGHCGHLKE